MTITITAVRQFLESQGIDFCTLTSPWDARGRWRGGVVKIPHAAVARPFLLQDEQGMVMAVVPVTSRLDLDNLNARLQRRLSLLNKENYPSVFQSQDYFILPALGAMADLETFVDHSLLAQEKVYIASGVADELICLEGPDFRRLNAQSQAMDLLSRAHLDKTDRGQAGADSAALTQRRDIRERIRRTTELPVMPSMARKLVRLSTNPYAPVEELSKLVKRDPSLSAQVVRYAQSSFYGYQGTVSSVRQAIGCVLGFDLVMSMALGFAVTKPFKLPLEGALGMRAFWRNAVYVAALTQSLSNLLPPERRVQPGAAYLSGLLHNFGILILGHLFPQEYELVRAAAEEQPHKPLKELEQSLLNTTHMEMGLWLMSEWNMPEEVQVVQRELHNPDFDGANASYVQLVSLSNYLLRPYGLGGDGEDELPKQLLMSLGLRMQQVNKVLEDVMGSAKNLDTLARKLAA